MKKKESNGKPASGSSWGFQTALADLGLWSDGSHRTLGTDNRESGFWSGLSHYLTNFCQYSVTIEQGRRSYTGGQRPCREGFSKIQGMG